MELAIIMNQKNIHVHHLLIQIRNMLLSIQQRHSNGFAIAKLQHGINIEHMNHQNNEIVLEIKRDVFIL